MEDGGPQPPLSVLEFTEWQVFYKLKGEQMERHSAELKEKIQAGKSAGKGSGGVDTNPPVIGSGRKKVRGR